jgi:hypothetical protein
MEYIALQLESRVAFRRSMKKAIELRMHQLLAVCRYKKRIANLVIPLDMFSTKISSTVCLNVKYNPL